MTGSAKQSIVAANSKAGLLRRFPTSSSYGGQVAPRNDDKTQLRIPAAQCARVLPKHPAQENRGRRESRVPVAPVASRAKCKKHTSVVTTGPDGFTRLSPRNGFNGLLRALPGDRACLPPSLANYSASLTPASGRQDHTTSPSASRRVRLSRRRRPSHPTPRP
jgi:hypothetical protein